MIVVDSSVWIANLRGFDTAETRVLRSTEVQPNIVVGDIVLMEVLRGARSQNHATFLETQLRRFHVEPMLDESLAIKAATHFRSLRDRGVTIRKTMDMIIGTFCIERGYTLLHQDRDFEPMVKYLDLKVM